MVYDLSFLLCIGMEVSQKFVLCRPSRLFWVFAIAYSQENVVFAGLCSLRKIHFSRNDMKFF